MTQSDNSKSPAIGVLRSRVARRALFCLFLAAVTFLAYLPAMRGGFVWDDDAWTTSVSGLLKDGPGLWTMWSKATALQQYYPLTGTWFWVDYQLWGFSPLAPHIENVFCHVVAAILFWRLLQRLEVPGAWAASLIFALHPVMVESAGWITERKNVLSLVFYLAALLGYGRFGGFWRRSEDERVSARAWGFYALALLFYLAATLSKATAFSLPAVILLICWWKRGRLRLRQDILPSVPFFAIAIGFGLFTSWLEKHHLASIGPAWDLTFAQRCLIAGRAIWFYVGKIFWPAGLCFLYPRWRPDVSVWWQWLYPICAVGTLVSLWLARGRIGRGPATAALFYVGTLFPVLGFMNAYGMRYAFVWDHWVYVSSLGLIALAAALVARAGERLRVPALLPVFTAGMVVLLGSLTWRQSCQYADMETLWQATLLKNPDAFLAHNQVGVTLLEQQKIDEAVAHFEKALEVEPNFAEAHSNLGNVRLRQNRAEEAVAQFQMAVQLDPGLATAHSNLGVTLMSRGQLDEAIAHLQRALQIRPDFAVTRNSLGGALQRKGETNAAIEQFQLALQSRPDYAEASYNLATALCDAGRCDEAMGYFEKALSLDPKLAVSLSNYGTILQQTKRIQEALALYQRAADADPSNPYFLNNLSWLLATYPDPTIRNGTRAVELGERAEQLTGAQDPWILGTVAAAYAEAGRFSNAVATIRQALELETARTNIDHVRLLEAHLKSYESGLPIRDKAEGAGDSKR